jgi:STE24 endopeptidase
MSEMTAIRIAKAATLAAGVALGVAAASVLWRTRVPADLTLESLDPRGYFSDAELARIESYRGPARMIALSSLAAGALVAVASVWKAPQLAGGLSRVARGRVRTGVAVAIVILGVTWIVKLPFAALAHRRRRQYGLSEQGYAAWLGDQALALAVSAVILALVVAGAMVLAGRFGRSWWVAGVPAATAAAVALVLVHPIVIDPLFNRFEPLRDRRLAREIRALAAATGVRIDEVQVADASRRTTTANAYVAGIGPSRRVVIYDTVVGGEVPRQELLVLAAHELAHVGRRHLWKGLAWFGLLAIPATYLVARAADRRGGLGNPAAVPLGLLVALGFMFATLPLQNAVSRRYEAEADWLALEATRDPAGAVALDRRLVRTNLADPDPPALLTFWLGTHPPLMKRIAMAEEWRRRSFAGR